MRDNLLAAERPHADHIVRDSVVDRRSSLELLHTITRLELSCESVPATETINVRRTLTGTTTLAAHTYEVTHDRVTRSFLA